MLAAIGRLRGVFPHATLRGFALIRTMTEGEVVAVKALCAGTIELLASGGTHREP